MMMRIMMEVPRTQRLKKRNRQARPRRRKHLQPVHHRSSALRSRVTPPKAALKALVFLGALRRPEMVSLCEPQLMAPLASSARSHRQVRQRSPRIRHGIRTRPSNLVVQLPSLVLLSMQETLANPVLFLRTSPRTALRQPSARLLQRPVRHRLLALRYKTLRRRHQNRPRRHCLASPPKPRNRAAVSLGTPRVRLPSAHPRLSSRSLLSRNLLRRPRQAFSDSL